MESCGKGDLEITFMMKSKKVDRWTIQKRC